MKSVRERRVSSAYITSLWTQFETRQHIFYIGDLHIIVQSSVNTRIACLEMQQKERSTELRERFTHEEEQHYTHPARNTRVMRGR